MSARPAPRPECDNSCLLLSKVDGRLESGGGTRLSNQVPPRCLSPVAHPDPECDNGSDLLGSDLLPVEGWRREAVPDC